LILSCVVQGVTARDSCRSSVDGHILAFVQMPDERALRSEEKVNGIERRLAVVVCKLCQWHRVVCRHACKLYTHAHTHAHARTHAHTHTRAHTHAHTHTHTHTCMTRIRNVHTYLGTRISKHTLCHSRSRAHTRCEQLSREAIGTLQEQHGPNAGDLEKLVFALRAPYIYHALYISTYTHSL